MVVIESVGISSEFSFEKEKAIAKTFSQRFQWEMIFIGLGQAIVWLSLWPLVIYEYIPFWVGFIIASVCACFAYLPSHEAQHGNYSRGKPKKKWIDKLVGHVTLITLIYPYEILRVTHMKHHAYTNDLQKDPDYQIVERKSALEVLIRSFDGGSTDYEKFLEVFANDRQAAVAWHEYDPKDLSVRLFSKGGDLKVKSLSAWDMNSIYTKAAEQQ